MIYTTITGDTWDLISYKVYGSEFHIDELMEANKQYTDIVIFSGGVEIKCPKISTKSSDKTTPWR